jgi:hypothetical protein
MILCPCCNLPIDLVAVAVAADLDGRAYLYPVCTRCGQITERSPKARDRLFRAAHRRIVTDPDRYGAMLFPTFCQAKMASGLVGQGQVGQDTVETFWGPVLAGKGHHGQRTSD